MKTYNILTLLLLCCFVSCKETINNAKSIAERPAIYPDYVGVTIPANIAPLDFCMSDESVQLIDVVITNSNGLMLHTQGHESAGIEAKDWNELLSHSKGDSLQVVVSAKHNGSWQTYLPFSIYVSHDSIDYGIAYRLVEPGYGVYSKMGIYECCLSNSQQTAIIENTQFQGCVNCHSFNRGNPAGMSLHIRGAHGATLLRLNSEIKAYNTATSQTLGSCVYPYWHPSGRYIAYSTNTTRQVFHVRDTKRIEVFDSASDLQVYDTETNTLLTTPLLMNKESMETFPAFSADGHTIFFCVADQKPAEDNQFDNIHYSLCSIAFNPEKGTFGDHIDTLVNAAAMGKSISFPRPSYDGRYLVYTMANYGQFSIWHPEADLYMLDLNDGSIRPMDGINSDNTESYHSWSSNSRWMVFSSRRDDGLFTRPYFTHINDDGSQTKPFMLPQTNPRCFYRDLFFSYNVPEFITGPVNYDSNKAVRAIESPERIQMQVATR
ncbi:MAG: hypothetical protein MJZ13_05535 [Bacteroidales bacterium]|nr:hypothetical protein [Bacteroidales bacterium]